MCWRLTRREPSSYYHSSDVATRGATNTAAVIADTAESAFCMLELFGGVTASEPKAWSLWGGLGAWEPCCSLFKVEAGVQFVDECRARRTDDIREKKAELMMRCELSWRAASGSSPRYFPPA